MRKGTHHTQATKDRMKETNGLNLRGIRFLQAHKDNLKASHIGNKHSQKTKNKVKQAMLTYWKNKRNEI